MVAPCAFITAIAASTAALAGALYPKYRARGTPMRAPLSASAFSAAA